MIIYNVTINIDDSVHEHWLSWMQEKHIPEMLGTGMFTEAKMVKVLIVEESGGTTYSVQFFTESKEKLEQYYNEFAPRMREEGARLFGDKMLAFRTELELLKEFKPE
jgi:sensor domain CHASE-containing protein